MDTLSAQKKKHLIFRLLLLLMAGFMATSLLSYYVSRRSLRGQIDNMTLPLTSDNIYSEIQRDLLEPVLIASLMAHDTFLRDWTLNGEADQAAITKYLQEIMSKYGAFTSFFVSEQTRNYYHPSGVLKQVHPEEERDTWYYRVREMPEAYEINVDPDMANQDAITIFINHRVFDYDNNYIGAAGVGLTTDAMSATIDRYRDKYDRTIYFADHEGTIMLKGSSLPEGVRKIQDLDGMAPIAEKVLTADTTRLTYSRNGQTIHLNTRFIPELDWYLLVEQAESIAVTPIFSTLVLNIVVCILITAVALLLTTLTMNAYEKVNREQQAEILNHHRVLQENNEALEAALAEVKTLSGFLPICATCKRIRDDQGYWQKLESYIQERSEAQFSHGICPDCLEEHYPDPRKTPKADPES